MNTDCSLESTYPISQLDTHKRTIKREKNVETSSFGSIMTSLGLKFVKFESMEIDEKYFFGFLLSSGNL